MNRYVEIISSNVEKNRGFFGSFFIVYHFVLIFFLGGSLFIRWILMRRFLKVSFWESCPVFSFFDCFWF